MNTLEALILGLVQGLTEFFASEQFGAYRAGKSLAQNSDD
jgi:hypothetical protein